LAFAKSCELGLEGIVSKREGSFYRSGKSRNWLICRRWLQRQGRHRDHTIVSRTRAALQLYLALPSTGPPKTIAAWKAYYEPQHGDPSAVEMTERVYDGLRKVGMPAGDKGTN
jgi:hypothetical protein